MSCLKRIFLHILSTTLTSYLLWLNSVQHMIPPENRAVSSHVAPLTEGWGREHEVLLEFNLYLRYLKMEPFCVVHRVMQCRHAAHCNPGASYGIPFRDITQAFSSMFGTIDLSLPWNQIRLSENQTKASIRLGTICIETWVIELVITDLLHHESWPLCLPVDIQHIIS